MWTFLLPAISFGFAAGVQPGPLTIYLINKTLQNGWRKTFPAIFVPAVTDGPVALVCLLILGNLPPVFLQYIRIGGGLFLLYLAWNAYKTWRKGSPGSSTEGTAARTIKDAMLINILNPNAYLGWSLVMGPMVIGAWKASPVNALLVLLCFYLTMFTLSAILLLLFHLSREKAPRLQYAFMGLSALFLALIGIWQLYSGLSSYF
ncbi:MAG: LysE family translocator [Syntrophothermus sp.]